jgi:ABC-type uncharacterized transport system substrate-binding protein
MERRDFIKLIGGVAASWPLAASAQQKTMPVIGLTAGTLKQAARFIENVRKGLADYGYIEGNNFRFEIQETNFQPERLPIIMRQFVDKDVALIVVGSTVALERAKASTQSIPIVFTIGSDPVESGFVASLNKPGGNLTGIYNLGLALSGKRLEVLREIIPSATKFAFLTDPNNVALGKVQTQAIEAARDRLGVDVLHVSARTPDEFDAAFEAAVREGVSGMVVGTDAVFFGSNSLPLMAAAERHRLPTIYVDDQPVRAGGLICYATDQDEANRIVGRYAGRILKGEKPADLPVQLSTKTTLIINLKSAKQLGITVPTSLLARADEVIE